MRLATGMLRTAVVVLAVLRAAPAWCQAPQVTPQHAEKMAAGLQLFKSSIRGMLTEHCLKCHGGQWVKGDFDLATRKSLIESGMVDDTAADSHLMLLVRHEEEPRMPKEGPRLSAPQLASLARWIDLGAPYDRPLADQPAGSGPMQVTDADRDFWSFRPLKAPAFEAPSLQATLRATLPPGAGAAQAGPIDAWVAAKQQSLGLRFQPRADKRVLLRRAYFGLIGLPPTPDEAKAFLADERADAYERLVDRLLDSPHYGERWARHWMDVARFAESHGYEQDYNRPHAYHYRDFLIRAFNQDMPFDQFVRWQLAGDELAPDQPLAMMATGFLGAGVFPTQLTEAEFESARYDELDDMTTTTGVAFLGLSIGCARCHDHKFDPIPTRDYYRLAATFTTTIRSELQLELDPQANARARQEYAERQTELEQALADYRSGAGRAAFVEWLKSNRTPASSSSSSRSTWTQLDGTLTSTAAKQPWGRLPDGSYRAPYAPPAKETLTLTAAAVGSIGSLRLEALTHDDFPRRGPGRASNGNFALGDIRVRLLRQDGTAERLKLAAARATHQQNTGTLSVAASIDDDPISGWAVDQGGIGHDQAAIFDLERPIEAKAGDQLEVVLVFQHPNTRHTMGRVRVSVSGQQEAKPFVGRPTMSRELQKSMNRLQQRLDGGGVLDWEKAEVQSAYEVFLAMDEKAAQLQAAVQQHLQQGPSLKLAKVQVSSEGVPHMKHHADGRGYPHFYRTTYHLNRGDVEQKREPAEPGFLQVLSQPGHGVEQRRLAPPTDAKTSFRRAALAQWLTDPDHGAGHLAARVIVNRVWQHHFGQGIVATPNDFGFQGERPSHPELLDFLAHDLIKHGWRLKRLHRQIMASHVYTQNSEFDPEMAKRDPENRFYWRKSPQRLEAEPIRDAMLRVSGQLDVSMYGPGSLDPGMRRRSVYFMIKRSQLAPMMMLFDWPEHLVSIGDRATTTVAPQALMFMNSPQGRQYAASFAKSLPMDTKKAVQAAYWRAFSRSPTAIELELSMAFLEQQPLAYQQQRNVDEDKAKRSSRTDFCQSLLSANEFIYID